MNEILTEDYLNSYPNFSTGHIRAKYRHLKATEVRVDHLTAPARARCGGHYFLSHKGEMVEFKLLGAE